MIRFCFCIFCISFFSHCGDTVAMQQRMINELLEERKEAFFNKKREDCVKQFAREVQDRVDSILTMRVKRTKYDSLTIPYDTLRPAMTQIDFPDYRRPMRERDSAAIRGEDEEK